MAHPSRSEAWVAFASEIGRDFSRGTHGLKINVGFSPWEISWSLTINIPQHSDTLPRMPYELDSEIRSRLIRYYQQVSDKELLDAAVKPDDLTPTAQEVVHAELAGRGLERAWPNERNGSANEAAFQPEPVNLPPNPILSQVPDPLSKPEFGEPLEKGTVSLITFYDALEARQAVEVLDAADIPFEVRDRSEPQSSSVFYSSGPSVALELVVDQRDRDRAVRELHDKRGLFPIEEVEQPDTWIDDGTAAIVGQFAKRADAEDVARVLTDAKIWNRITANPDGSAATEDAFLVEVREVDLFRAGELVEKALNLPEV